MPDLKITISATQEQAELWAQCQALVLFLTPQEIEAMRLNFGAIHMLAQQIQAGINAVLPASTEGDPTLPEIPSDMQKMAEEIERRVHDLKLKMGFAYFAQPGANGETIQ